MTIAFASFRPAAIGLLTAMLTIGCSDGSERQAQAALTPEQQQIQAGERLARTCFGCHGPEGRSRVDSYPTLAGRSQAYLAEQLRAFRSGERENPMMGSIAKNLDEDAIDALSHYFASVEVNDE